MTHKFLNPTEHSLMNLINYMSTFTSETVFKGFIPLKKDYFGVKIADKYYAAIHLFTDPYPKQRSDDPVTEKKFLDKGYNTLLVIYGNDNSSYMKRFRNHKAALSWIKKTDELVRDDTWLWYNS